MTPTEIRRQGIAALRERLGVMGMIRFLQQLQVPTGDYTIDRRLWMDQLTLDDIAELARQNRAKAKRSRARKTSTAARSASRRS
jgi:hypothetical protein